MREGSEVGRLEFVEDGTLTMVTGSCLTQVDVGGFGDSDVGVFFSDDAKISYSRVLSFNFTLTSFKREQTAFFWSSTLVFSAYNRDNFLIL